MSKPPTTAGQTGEPDYLLIPDKKGVCKLGMKRHREQSSYRLTIKKGA